MSTLKATVIVPTCLDRGPLLQYSVGSILKQTVKELEVFIIGDGAHDITREAARALERQDSRVRFSDHPKGPRRGEIYRHQALQEARGEIVCYLCDRDLYLPNHVEEMRRLLGSADYANTLVAVMGENGVRLDEDFDLSQPDDRKRKAHGPRAVALSFSGHTLEMYRRLERGWTTTPAGALTDVYMAQQFLRHSGCRAVSGSDLTVLCFRRGVHPGWSSARRLPEVREWAGRIQTPSELAPMLVQLNGRIQEQRAARARLRAQAILIGGEPLSWRTPLLPLINLRKTVIRALITRQHLPWARSLRNTWRRLTGREAV